MNPTFLHTMLAESRQAGVYQITDDTRDALQDAANTLGFASFNVDVEDCTGIDAALGALGRDLDFPDWYGVNFDALNDCLADLSWCEAPGYMIVIDGAAALRSTDAGNFATLNEVFTNAIETWQEQDIPLWVIYALSPQVGTDELAPLPSAK